MLSSSFLPLGRKLRKLTGVLAGLTAMSFALPAGAQNLDIIASHDTFLTNDNNAGPTSNQDGSSALHIRYFRDAGGTNYRVRPGLIRYDLTAIEQAYVLENVQLQLTTFDGSSGKPGMLLKIYGVKEEFDAIDETTATYANSPGVDVNFNTLIVLDTADLVSATPLATLTTAADLSAALSDISTAMDDFVNADTDGILTFIITPDVPATEPTTATDIGSFIYRREDLNREPRLLATYEITGPTPTPTPTPIPTANLELEAHWPLNENSGTVADEVINGAALDGTLVNFDSNTWLGRAASLTSGSLRFPGIDEYVEAPHNAAIDFTTDSFSVSFLLKQTGNFPDGDPVEENRYFTKGTYAPTTGVRYEAFNKFTNFTFSLDDGTVKTDLSVNSAPIVTGNWVHVVCVRNTTSDTLQVYADGVLLGSATDNVGSVANSNPITFGTSIAADRPASIGFATAQMDDIRIYRNALNWTDIFLLAEEYEPLIINRAKSWNLFE